MGISYYDYATGKHVEVSDKNPLPVTGGGSAEVTDEDIAGAVGAETYTVLDDRYAQGEASDFATAAQGTKADSAIQSVPAGVAVADATDADDVVDQFNALLASLRTAGLIAS